MKWRQVIRKQFPQHKYAIHAEVLGDHAELAWSNLGYWDDTVSSYPMACEKLAQHLAQSVNLNAEDVLLDLGCGQGASLEYWLKHFHIQNLAAVELQAECVQKIQKNLNSNYQILQNSFLNLKQIFPQSYFDVVLCIDAAYHSELNLFIKSINSVLNSKARIGFHYLMLSPDFLNLNSLQKLKYKSLLRAADVNLADLKIEYDFRTELMNLGFEKIEIQDLSEMVFAGFSCYIQQQGLDHTNASLFDLFKIQMTAKLCQRLWADGLIRYVQVTAHKI